MNRRIIIYTLGNVCRAEAVLMLLPCLFAIFYQEMQGIAYAITAVCTFVLGFLLSRKRPTDSVFYLKEGCIATALAWIVMSLIGAVPFVVTGEIPFYPDALFETISGFTTTGSSILSDVEVLSHTSLLWRSFTHWIGGMGVLVFILAIVPLSGGSNINLMKAESPGPSVGKLTAHIKNTAQSLYLIYIVLTIAELVILAITGMAFFDDICITFGTAGTGGFGVRNSSCGDYTAIQQWIIAIFMILFGINFNFYYFIFAKSLKKAFGMEEVKTYLAIIAVAAVIISCTTVDRFSNAADAIRGAVFQTASVITTTGYSTVDFNNSALYPMIAKGILVLLMFFGACAGSTGGGIKISRIIVAAKSFFREAGSYIHPKSVRQIKMDGAPVAKDTVRSVNIYLVTFAVIFAVSCLLIMTDGKDFETSFTSVAATINNIGPGLGDVGPASNFASFSIFSKFILMFDMLAGRLELYPMLLLFSPTIWGDMRSDLRARRRRLRGKG